jgi:nucleotide-binding universal stress UspA family protein
MAALSGEVAMLHNIKSILIGLTEEGDAHEPSSALGYGLSLARLASAHVTVQAASLKLRVAHAFVGEIAAVVARENWRLQTLAKTAAETSRQDATACGVTCTAESPQLAYPELIRSFAGQARVHDLTVLDAEPIALAVERGIINAVLTDSGRPLIVVAEGWDVFQARRIVVAWDGSAKAARALNDALPLLRAAEKVDLVCVTGEKDLSDSLPGVEVAPHLARHGVNVTVADVAVRQGDVAKTLRNYAVLFDVDLIVMGAFVHSRLRQFMLGGTTRSLLKDSPVSLFLSY